MGKSTYNVRALGVQLSHEGPDSVFGNNLSTHMLWSTFKILTRMEDQTEVCAEVSKMGEEV